MSKFCSHDLTFFGIFVNVKLGELKRVPIKIVANIKKQDGDECMLWERKGCYTKQSLLRFFNISNRFLVTSENIFQVAARF